MKKTYINPRLEVIKIKRALMLVPGSANLDTTQSITNSDDFGAREYDFDEDEY